MKFKFVGQYTGDRDSIAIYGVTFNGREPSEVSDAHAIEALSRSVGEFEAVKAPNSLAESEKAPASKPKATKPRKARK